MEPILMQTVMKLLESCLASQKLLWSIVRNQAELAI